MKIAQAVLLAAAAAFSIALGAAPAVAAGSEERVRAQLEELQPNDSEILLHGDFTIERLFETLSQLGAFKYELAEDVDADAVSFDQWKTTLIEALAWIADERGLQYEFVDGVLHVSPAA